MWVRRLTLTNFRGFASLDLDLDRPLTVLVGVNGSGKSSVLRALVALHMSLQFQSDGQFGIASSEGALDPADVRAGAIDACVGWKNDLGSPFEHQLVWVPERDRWSTTPLLDNDQRALFERLRPMLYLADTGRRIESAAVRAGPFSGVRGQSRIIDGVSVTVGSEDFAPMAPSTGYARFLEWFKEREDVENALRVQKRDLDLQDPQLRAVREAVAALMPGFENLRIERDPSPAMVVTKAGIELRLDQLSDGERNLIALAGDLARRLVIAHPDHPEAREVEAVILIDEVEQHLHPALQRKVIPSLQRAFPKAQLIVTTHSPQVLSSVPASAVVVLDHFEALPVSAPTQGRDTNAILREVFGVSERPEEEVARVRAITAMIDDGRLDEARAALKSLAEKLSEHDDEVQRLRTQIDFAEVGL